MPAALELARAPARRPSPPVSASASPPQTRSAMLVRSSSSRVAGRLAGQHLARQVVGHRAVVARELGDERVRVGLARSSDRPGQPQAGRPALGALEQARDLLLRAARAPSSASSAAASSAREREVRRAQLAEPAGEAQALERELGIRARGGDDVQRAAAVHDELAERGEAGAAQQVEVVEHEHGALAGAGQRVGEPQREVVVQRRTGVEPVDRHLGAPQRREHVGPQPARVAVARAEREPGGAALRGPAAQEHGLAPAGRCADERERAARGAASSAARRRGRSIVAAGRGGMARADGEGAAHASSPPVGGPGGNGARRCVRCGARTPGAVRTRRGGARPPSASVCGRPAAAGAPRSARARATGCGRAARAVRSGRRPDRAGPSRSVATSASMPSNGDSAASLTRPRTRIS